LTDLLPGNEKSRLFIERQTPLDITKERFQELIGVVNTGSI